MKYNFGRLLVLYNKPVLPEDHLDYASEADILDVVGWLKPVLNTQKVPYRVLGIDHDPKPLITAVKSGKYGVVFNLFEGLATRPITEVSAASLLDWLDIAYTGSPASVLALCNNKVQSKYLMLGAGLPTPVCKILKHEDEPRDWPHAWPAFVKPGNQDASVGIGYDSIVKNPVELEAQCQKLMQAYGFPIIIEEYIEGREIHFNVIEEKDGTLTAIPPSELRFNFSPGQERPTIYTREAKWDLKSPEYLASEFLIPAPVKAEVLKRMTVDALRAFELFGLQGYARFDMRLNAAGDYFILEANPNPFLFSPTIDEGLKVLGRTHADFVLDQIELAYRRKQKASS
jgi:D-alanine-D-alanine ligase